MKAKQKITPLQKISITAMLMALSVVIGILCKNFFTWNIYYRVTFENFPVILAGFCFGPLWGAAAGIGADIVSCLCSTNPVVNPVITAGAACVGLLAGMIPLLMKHADERVSLALSVAAAHLVGQVAVKSLGKILFYNMPAAGILIGLGISCGVGIAEYFILRLLLRNKGIAAGLGRCSDAGS